MKKLGKKPIVRNYNLNTIILTLKIAEIKLSQLDYHPGVFFINMSFCSQSPNSNSDSHTVITTQPRNVTTVRPYDTPNPHILDTSSSTLFPPNLANTDRTSIPKYLVLNRIRN